MTNADYVVFWKISYWIRAHFGDFMRPENDPTVVITLKIMTFLHIHIPLVSQNDLNSFKSRGRQSLLQLTG